MNDGGRAAVVLDTGAVTRGSGSKNEDKERNIRKWFVDHDLIEGVILLPDNLFYNTTAAGVIVVLNKRKPRSRKGKIVAAQRQQALHEGQAQEPPRRRPTSSTSRSIYQAGRAGRGRGRRHRHRRGRGGRLQPQPGAVGAQRPRPDHRADHGDRWQSSIALDDRATRDRRALLADAGEAVSDWRGVDDRWVSSATSARADHVGRVHDWLRTSAVPADLERLLGPARSPIVDQGCPIAGWTDATKRSSTGDLLVCDVRRSDERPSEVRSTRPSFAEPTAPSCARSSTTSTRCSTLLPAVAFIAPRHLRGYNRHFTLPQGRRKSRTRALPEQQVDRRRCSSAVETRIAVQRCAVTACDELKRAAMHELFSRGLRGEAQRRPRSA